MLFMTTFLRQVCILVQDLKPANQANLFDILDVHLHGSMVLPCKCTSRISNKFAWFVGFKSCAKMCHCQTKKNYL